MKNPTTRKPTTTYPTLKIWFRSLSALCICVFGLTNIPLAQANPSAWAEPAFRHRPMVQKGSDPYYKPEPEYAKWGKIAVSETKKRYPDAHIVDYLHVGRTVKGGTLVQETFKLWLRSAPREFGVFVTIGFDKNTEQIQSIQICETKR